MLVKKLKVSITAYWISCIIVFFMIGSTEIINVDFQFGKSLLEGFLLVSYLIFLGVFFYAYPIALFTELLIKKLPESKKAFKFIVYIFFGLLFAVIFIFFLFGMSFFSILVFVIYFIVDELLLKNKDSLTYKITTRSSYVIFVIILGLFSYKFLIESLSF